MRLGLRNALATFQRVMDTISINVNWQSALVYLDDIPTFSKTIHENISHAKLVFTLPREAGVTLKLKRGSFITSCIDYLGPVIKHGPLEVANHAADGKHELKVPTRVSEPRSLFVICIVFQVIIPNLARVVSLLSTRLEKTQEKELRPLNAEVLKELNVVKGN